MGTPYVQDVSRWINYYSRHGTSLPNVDEGTQPTDTVGLAQESNMSVSKVEPKGSAPPPPHTGPSVTLHSVTPSQESVVQAAYSAKRVSLEKGNTNGQGTRSANSSKKKKKKKKVGGSKGSKTKKKVNLYGTPGDIFKSKTYTKKKKKNNNNNK